MGWVYPLRDAIRLKRPASTSSIRKWPDASVVAAYAAVRGAIGASVTRAFLTGSPVAELTTMPSTEHLSSGLTSGVCANAKMHQRIEAAKRIQPPLTKF